MRKIWTISANDVGPGANGSGLVGCHLVLDDDGNTFHFQKPDRKTVASWMSPTVPPTLPFTFPVFQSKLAGSKDTSWYITVCNFGTITGDVRGRFSIKEYIACEATPTGEPPDTWVAQAGPGAGEDEEDAAAASASAY